MAHEPQFLYLTTTGRRSGLPRTIEIWFTTRHDRFYVIAEHGDKAQWVQNLQANPQVSWRVAQSEYRGRARILDPVEDSALSSAVQAGSRQKYGWGDGLVVELMPEL